MNNAFIIGSHLLPPRASIVGRYRYLDDPCLLIPLGWALDSDGRPTTDPQKGLQGSMAPAGGYKGFGQGLIVEVMCAAMSGALLGTQMGSFTDNDRRPVDCGQFFIALNPENFSGGLFDKQVKILTRSILGQTGARLPNARREANKKRLAKAGLTLSKDLHGIIRAYAAPTPQARKRQ